MWQNDWRNRIWVRLGDPWDIIVVGGGITGAGILREAARLGLRALLVDKKDFSWGTSSRSTKLVHGGLRYLKQGQFGVTYHSVRERERLLREGPGLIEPLGFLMATYEGDTSRRVFGAGLAMYDLFASRRDHQYYAADDFQMLAPHVSAEKLEGGFRYGDALTDDARLVLRIIREAVRDGAAALNYAAAERLLLDTDGDVNGVRLRDQVTDRAMELHASVVINATGAWADRLRIQVGGQARIRPSRGSHLIFPAWRFPAAQAITLWHPDDHRPVFVIPWEGVTLVGTTDLDHQQPLDEEPQIDSGETAYLMAALEARFPKLHLGLEDVLASFAGIRPIVGTGKEDPSKESRAHTVVVDEGLITVTGGKLTTYRLMVRDTLKAAARSLPVLRAADETAPCLNPVPPALVGAPESMDGAVRRRLLGRYAADTEALVAAALPGELERIPGTRSLWAELRWAARDEGVVHLDDLLLRRVRLGLLLPQGAMLLLHRIRAIVQPELGWSDILWEREVTRYAEIWAKGYSPPDSS